MRPIVTLTTDFGTDDSYVGVMKGVILSICPDAQLVDISHAIPPQDIAAAARMLPSYVPYFPAHTVHLVVVDPGVGSARQPLAWASPGGQFVGPDNGVFSPLWIQQREQWPADEVRAVVLEEPRFRLAQVSTTFHGRDIFAPAAAHLAAGVLLDELGPSLETPVPLALPLPTWEADGKRLEGRIVSIDHFGNCISNVTAAHLHRLGPLNSLVVRVAGKQLPVVQTYADVAPGKPLALLGSDGELEISLRNGSASQTLGITTDTNVIVEQQEQC